MSLTPEDREALRFHRDMTVGRLADTVEAIVARHVAAAVTEARAAALNEAAGAASWMEYPASNDPRHWAKWLRNLAADPQTLPPPKPE